MPRSGIFNKPIYDDLPDPSPLLPPLAPSAIYRPSPDSPRVVINRHLAGVVMRSIGIKLPAAIGEISAPIFRLVSSKTW